MGAAALILVLASLGLPGLANFVAEFMTLAGTFAASRIIAVLAALGLIAAAIYSLRIMQKVFFGPSGSSGIKDLSTIEAAIIASVVILLIFLGLYPRPVTQKVEPIVEKVVTISLEKEPDSMGQLSAEKIKPANGKY
jgi:NADH-quinone oxidoreductase subunit M